MNLFTPSDVAARVREEQVNSSVGVLWLAMSGDRDPFKRELDELLSDLPVVVLVVRSRGFDDPNALLADLVSILNDSQAHCVDRLARFASAETFQIVLLAKKQLSIAQASSPVILPRWFPILPTQNVHAVVRDETWQLTTAVNDPRTGVPDLSAAVYQVEAALLRRLRAQMGANPQSGDSLFAHLDKPPAANLAQCVDTFLETHNSVTHPAAFRPSLRTGSSLVAQIWRLIQVRGTQQLGKPAAALATALGVTDASVGKWGVRFTGLLLRPVDAQTPSHAFARDVVLAIAFACQLSTAAAHSDQYPHYPVPLLTSFGQMLLATLSDALVVVDSLD